MPEVCPPAAHANSCLAAVFLRGRKEASLNRSKHKAPAGLRRAGFPISGGQKKKLPCRVPVGNVEPASPPSTISHSRIEIDQPGGDVHIRAMLERLADLDRMEYGSTCFKMRIPTKSPKRTDMKSPVHSETMSPTFPI